MSQSTQKFIGKVRFLKSALITQREGFVDRNASRGESWWGAERPSQCLTLSLSQEPMTLKGGVPHSLGELEWQGFGITGTCL